MIHLHASKNHMISDLRRQAVDHPGLHPVCTHIQSPFYGSFKEMTAPVLGVLHGFTHPFSGARGYFVNGLEQFSAARVDISENIDCKV